jgi:LuxR family quorum sensing-dependent transcriptional regulator
VYATETLEILDQIQACRSRDELARVFGDAVAGFGFAASCISQYAVLDGLDRIVVLLDGLPEHVAERLVAPEAGQNPISQRALETDEPFCWHDLADALKHSPLLVQATADGFVDGFCIPVRMPVGGRGLVSLLSQGSVRLTAEDRLALRAMAHAAHQQVLHLLPEASKSARLTAREREVLRWTAAGKTADATAGILSISVRTVEYHLLNAARKLNTANRTHTVVEALRSRQLSI